MVGKRMSEISIGEKTSYQKTITESDVYLFAGITGDISSAHLNEVEAQKGICKGRIAHGPLTGGLISAVLGVQLPGPGTIYLGQELRFKAPVRFGNTIMATVEVIEVQKDKNVIRLRTMCINQNDELVIEGYATVMPSLGVEA